VKIVTIATPAVNLLLSYTVGNKCHMSVLEIRKMENDVTFEENQHLNLQITNMSIKKIMVLEQKISDLKSQLPAHSVPPSMIIKLEDFEDELDKQKLLLQLKGGRNAQKNCINKLR
jgi:hypothetical protein